MRRTRTEQAVFKSIGSLFLLLSFNLLALAGDPPAGAIRGKTTTSDNKPAAGVTVQVKSIKRAVLTESDGQFIIRNLAAGTYELEI